MASEMRSMVVKSIPKQDHWDRFLTSAPVRDPSRQDHGTGLVPSGRHGDTTSAAARPTQGDWDLFLAPNVCAHRSRPDGDQSSTQYLLAIIEVLKPTNCLAGFVPQL